MSYPDFFKALTSHDPSPFQERVADAILQEKSVILRAPTGSGKTWAVVAPFLYAISEKNPIADRLLYALPLRSLATSLFDSTISRVFDNQTVKEIANRIRIQTGERRDDDRFDGLVTFTTIDQLLSSYLLQPVGLPQRCGNLNAGALLGAMICFDEFHLLEPSKSMATALEMLDTLVVRSPVSRFVLMTATLSTSTLQRLRTQLKAELIDVSEGEADSLHMQQGRVRRYVWRNEPLSAASVVREHRRGRSIVVVNTVRKAQELFEELRSAEHRNVLGTETRLRLLHSRFFAKDRQVHEADLASWFGPEPTVNDVILVSTQVIEAGLDFSCDNLHSELAPMNALVQRAGRCARRAGQSGTVWCYASELNDSGNPKYGPYVDLSHVVDGTAEALAETVGQDGRVLKYHDELRLVDRVHTEWEQKQATSVREIRSRVRLAMNGDHPAGVRELVRDVDSINVVITDSPDSLQFNRHKWPEMLSVPMTSLWALFKSDEPSNSPWVAKAAREKDASERGAIEITWETIGNRYGLLTAGWLIAIHPGCASYSHDVGLVIGRGGVAPEIEYRQRPVATRYHYSKETYDDHIRRVRSAGNKHEESNRVATARIAVSLKMSPQELVSWLDLLWALHDVGKLTEGWQDAIWDWQSRKTGPPNPPRPALAHSDYHPETDYRLSLDAKRRPPHASEGALAVSTLLEERIGCHDMGAYHAAVTAIARHHGPHTTQVSEFRLLSDADAYVENTLGKELWASLVSGNSARRRDEFKRDAIFQCSDPSLESCLPLYLYFCRRLRLADQGSFGEE